MESLTNDNKLWHIAGKQDRYTVPAPLKGAPYIQKYFFDPPIIT